MRVLFVCSGNICRSPMAAEYLRHRASTEGLFPLTVDSAGTLGIEGERATREAVQVLREEGLDLTGHRSKGLRVKDLRDANLVVVMAPEHLCEIERRYPGVGGNRVLLRAFERAPEPDDNPRALADPIGRSIEFYREQFSKIRLCVDHIARHLKQSS